MKVHELDTIKKGALKFGKRMKFTAIEEMSENEESKKRELVKKKEREMKERFLLGKK